MNSQFVMAIDLGITNVKVGLVDKKGRISHFKRQAIVMEQGAGGVSDVMIDLCREVLAEAEQSIHDMVAVGCCVPGVVNPEDGIIVASAALGWEGLEVRKPLEDSFMRSVTVEGKGAVTALSAYHFGPTAGQDHLLGISVGTGISCGFINEGKLLRGSGQAALEAGHMPLFFDNGHDCSCGLKGCWEAHVGGHALLKVLVKLRQKGLDVPQTPEELAQRAYAGDTLPKEIWDKQGELLGRGIAILLNVLNPRSVVVAGGFANAWTLYKKSLMKTARNNALTRNSQVAIVCAPDPERAPILGACVAALQDEGRLRFLDEPKPYQPEERDTRP